MTTAETTIRLAAITIAMAIAPGFAQAGQLLFDMSNQSNPVISVNTVNGSPGICLAFEPYSTCLAVDFSPPTGTTDIRVLDGFTGISSDFAVSSNVVLIFSDIYSSSADPLLEGGAFEIFWQASTNTFGEATQYYTPEFSATQPCDGTCDGQLTGGLQNLATITYFNAGGSVLGTDSIDVITPGSATPEPSTALMLIPGLLLGGWLVQTRSRR